MKVVSIIFMFGVVDSIDANMVSVEITDRREETKEVVSMVLPESLFPCEIKEGSKFYFAKVEPQKENVRILCGEPPKEPI